MNNILDTNQGKQNKYDLIFSTILVIISIAILVYGIFIFKTMKLGKGIAFYSSPALFPVFIGSVLLMLSLLLVKKTFRYRNINIVDISSFKNSNLKTILSNYRQSEPIRFIIELLLIAIYVFILIGNLPFYIATFIFLFFNMIIFRENGFAVWKLLIISIIFSVLISFMFSKVANIPLP